MSILICVTAVVLVVSGCEQLREAFFDSPRTPTPGYERYSVERQPSDTLRRSPESAASRMPEGRRRSIEDANRLANSINALNGKVASSYEKAIGPALDPEHRHAEICQAVAVLDREMESVGMRFRYFQTRLAPYFEATARYVDVLAAIGCRPEPEEHEPLTTVLKTTYQHWVATSNKLAKTPFAMVDKPMNTAPFSQKVSTEELVARLSGAIGRHGTHRLDALARPWQQSIAQHRKGLPGYPRWLEVTLRNGEQALQTEVAELMLLHTGNTSVDVKHLRVVVAFRDAGAELLSFLWSKLRQMRGNRFGRMSSRLLKKELEGKLKRVQRRMKGVFQQANSLSER